MDLMDKLTILADAAKYDAACTSSGLDRAGRAGRLGSTMAAGCCHSFSADGRCISLLKILSTNICAYDCPGLLLLPGSWPNSPSSSTAATILRGSFSPPPCCGTRIIPPSG